MRSAHVVTPQVENVNECNAKKKNIRVLAYMQAVIIEISAVQALRLRTNQWQVHKVKYLPPTK